MDGWKARVSDSWIERVRETVGEGEREREGGGGGG